MQFDLSSATRAEEDYRIARIALEQALDADKLTPADIDDIRVYQARASLALDDVRRAFDAKDAVLFERAAGILALNAERMKNTALHGGKR